MAEFYKVITDPNRLRIIHLLARNELCVHEIASLLEISQSALSHQLKILRQQKLVKPRKEGKHVYYSLSDEYIIEIIKSGLEHLKK